MNISCVEDRHQCRPLYVYLPDGYDDSTDHYPVVYVQDGGSLVDPQYSDALLTIRKWTAAGELPGLIFVGIEPFDRNDEYTPFVSPNIFEPGTGKMYGGQAARYAAYLADELKPYIDSTYRTRPEREHTAIIGFSFGGLISVYTALLYPGTYRNIGSFSGSFWFPGIVDWIRERPIPDSGQRLFMNVGDGEGKGRTSGQQWMVPNNKQVYAHFLQHGFSERTVKQVVYESPTHSFVKGVLDLPGALRWMFGNSDECVVVNVPAASEGVTDIGSDRA